MCNCRKNNNRMYQELAQTLDALIREHKAYKRQRKAIVDAINELAEQVEEHEAVLEEMYTHLAEKEQKEHAERSRTQRKQRHQCNRCGRRSM